MGGRAALPPWEVSRQRNPKYLILGLNQRHREASPALLNARRLQNLFQLLIEKTNNRLRLSLRIDRCRKRSMALLQLDGPNGLSWNRTIS
jgi:hypothetical protein